MDFLAKLPPAVPPLLDPTNPLHNVTLLQNTFIGAFLGTFLANLGAQTVRMILGESVIVSHLIQYKIDLIVLQSKTSPEKKDTDWRMIPAVAS